MKVLKFYQIICLRRGFYSNVINYNIENVIYIIDLVIKMYAVAIIEMLNVFMYIHQNIIGVYR